MLDYGFAAVDASRDQPFGGLPRPAQTAAPVRAEARSRTAGVASTEPRGGFIDGEGSA
ncbi:hypothetical protein ABZ297_36650 [Nonomuraea sp. NPDC005983]|uniref:hypothetical protein n=1 Tax=Nonomuraea sp. NPDC005983 TaxID=3155595 RepID=UPI0033A62F5F